MFQEQEPNDNLGSTQPVKSSQPEKRSAGSGRNSGAAVKDQVRTCSYCGQSFLRSETKHMPFCSRRCQQIDLGMWLNESYGLPHEGEGAPDYDPESDL